MASIFESNYLEVEKGIFSNDYVARYIYQTKSFSEHEPSNQVNASSGYCPRLAGIKSKESTYSKYNWATNFFFKFGSASEKALHLLMNNRLIHDEVRLSDIVSKNYNFGLGSRIDFFGLYEDDILVIYELKTCTKVPKKPKPIHLSQTRLYQAIIPFNVVLDYQERGVFEVGNYTFYPANKEFVVKFSFKESYDALLKAIKGYVFSEEGFLPPKLFSKKDKSDYCKQYGNCHFYKLCHGRNNEEFIKENIKVLKKPSEYETKKLTNKSKQICDHFMSLDEVNKRYLEFIEILKAKNENK